MSDSGRAHAQLPNIHHTKTLLYVPHERNYSCTSTYGYIEITLSWKPNRVDERDLSLLSRGRHFCPSLPGDRYLKLGSKSDLRAEISGNIVGYDALAPRPEVLRSFSCIHANKVLCVFCVHLAYDIQCLRHPFASFNDFPHTFDILLLPSLVLVFLEYFTLFKVVRPSLSKILSPRFQSRCPSPS